MPRSSHAIFQAAAHRNPIELLQRQAQTRVPELVPIRYGRLLVSPFTFYRGAALIMAAGPASTARSSGSPPPTPSRTSDYRALAKAVKAGEVTAQTGL